MSVSAQQTSTARLIGGPQSGKTGRLLELARELADDPTMPTVLLLVAAPACVEPVRARLSEALGSRTAAVRVAIPREIALEVLSRPGVAEKFGRRARLMEPFEERFLMEDLRASRMKGRRLGDVLGFLQSGWSRLADEDPDWIQTSEERAVVAHVRANLAFTGGVLRSELANFSVKALRDDPALREAFMVDHVLVDDYASLERASQQLACALARRSITIAADPTPPIPADEAYPYPQGLDEFCDAYPATETVVLPADGRPAGIARALCRLREDEALCGGSAAAACEATVGETAAETPVGLGEGVTIEMGATMGDELRAIFSAVKETVDAGGSALVVGTDRVWRANVARALEGNGIAVEPARPGVSVRDLRDEKGCARAFAATLDRLRADPRDGVAWRCAVGFGDYMARSAAVDRLQSAALPKGMRIDTALAALADGSLDGADANEPLLAGLLESYRRIKGLACDVRGEAAPSDREPDARGPRAAVVGPQEAFGRQADLVVFGGFVNGFIPSRDYLDPGKLVGASRRRVRENDVRSLYLVVGRARSRLMLSGFTAASLETAERLGLHAARIRLKEGVRMCDIEPSELLGALLPRSSPPEPPAP